MQPKFYAIALIILSTLVGCSRYQVTINDNVVYTPPKLLSEFSVYDSGLNQCLTRTIEESNIASLTQLRTLICPGGEIENLSGLEQFSSIERLSLKNNNVQNITVLSQLNQLVHVDLSNNQIQDFSPLIVLTELNTLDTRGNREAHCKPFEHLLRKVRTVSLPEHCQ